MGGQMNKENMDLNYWRSFQELYANDSFVKQTQNEFSDKAAEAPELAQMSQMSRRKFVGLMSASAALAGTACSKYRDEGELIPYNNQTETTTPGITYHYASSITRNGQTEGVLIKVREGRPIKIVGNAQHPVNKGGISASTQAMMMSLYDPDRLKKPLINGAKSTFAEADTLVKAAIVEAQSQGKKVVLLGNKNVSPLLKGIVNEAKALNPETHFVSFDAYDRGLASKAQKTVFGKAVKYRLDKADLVISFESDFLGSEGSVEQKKEFAVGRDIVQSGKQNKLIAIEGDMSLTGINADWRLPVRSDAVETLLVSLLAELVFSTQNVKEQLSATQLNYLDSYRFDKISASVKVEKKDFEKLLKDISERKGKVLVKVGQKLGYAAFVASELLNSFLATELMTSSYASNESYEVGGTEELKALVNDLNQGNIGVLINLNGNPLFNLPADLGLAEAIKKAGLYVSMVESLNESCTAAKVVLPVNHPLESWGIYESRQGLVELQQPVIAPLFNSRQLEDLLISYLGQKNFSDIAAREWIKNYVQTVTYTQAGSLLTAGEFWVNALHDGFVKTKTVAQEFSANWEPVTSIKPASLDKGMVLVLKASQYLGDGALANVGWLQELPHPVSKVAWDNYAAMSINTMKKLGLKRYPKSGDFTYEVVVLTVGKNSIEIPAFTQPGLADDQVVVELGYGRSVCGNAGIEVGVNAIDLLSINSKSGFIVSNVQVASAGKFYELASTQEQSAINAQGLQEDMGVKSMLATRMEDSHLKRRIIQEGTVEEYKANPHFLHEGEHYPTASLNRPHKYAGVKWAMSIDLNKCTGCGDCIIACNVENNIPVVGKDQVKVGREMHWMRIDRYYSGDAANPRASVQPMLCQHCDNAPCENVCPVVATTHSPEGINEMTYNRCVGTRYCANNCPYKVRRFNFFNFRDHFANEHQQKPVFALLHNPEVSVRSRGVMEKCSFCVQRVNLARAASKRAHEEWNGQGMVTACQEVCSANAIAFGNINDADSTVARNKKHALTYRVLDETAVESNVRYLAKIRNIEGKSHS